MKSANVAAILLLGIGILSGLACCGDGGSPVKPTHTPGPTTPPGPTSSSTATLSPTTTASPTPTATIVVDIRITHINYKGKVPFTEADEYVTIKNFGDQHLNLDNWVLRDITDGYPSFIFDHFIIEPSRSIRVYTDQYNRDWGGLTFAYPEPIWNNSHPDVAALFNPDGVMVSNKSYVID